MTPAARKPHDAAARTARPVVRSLAWRARAPLLRLAHRVRSMAGSRSAPLLVALATSTAAGAGTVAQARARAPLDAPTAQLMSHCFELASRRYGMSALLLQAIAQQESGLNPRALNRNGNGSVDIGLMQINSWWLPVLARHGIGATDLWEPCTNIMVGAWILGDNLARIGPTVAALGAYNARDPVKRERYARQVLQRLTRLEQQTLPAATAATHLSPPTR